MSERGSAKAAAMIALVYLPVLAALHFSAGSALGGMAVLSAKALLDLSQEAQRRSSSAQDASQDHA